MKLKNIILLLSLIFFAQLISTKVNGQEYMDLLVRIVDEDYEKCLKKSLKYTNKSETRKDPLPYLYASMAYYNMSRDNQYREDFPKAFKQALRYVGKYRRKDKSYAYKEDAVDYIEKLKFVLAEVMENNLLLYQDRPTRAIKKNISLLKKIEKMDPEDKGITLLRGVYEIKNRNRSEGRDLIEEALEYINTLEDVSLFDSLTESQQHYLKKGMIEYALFKNEDEPEESKRILELGKPFFIEENSSILIDNTNDFKKVYKEIFS